MKPGTVHLLEIRTCLIASRLCILLAKSSVSYIHVSFCFSIVLFSLMNKVVFYGKMQKNG